MKYLIINKSTGKVLGFADTPRAAMETMKNHALEIEPDEIIAIYELELFMEAQRSGNFLKHL